MLSKLRKLAEERQVRAMKDKRREEWLLTKFGLLVEGKMFGEDINEFSREELLATINYLTKELEYARKDADRGRGMIAGRMVCGG